MRGSHVGLRTAPKGHEIGAVATVRGESGRLNRCFSNDGGRGSALAALLLVVAIVGALVSASPAAAGQRHVFAGAFEGGEGGLSEPDGVAVSEATGDVYVADRGNNRIEQFNAAGTFLAAFDGSAAPTGALSSPTAIAVDNSADPLDPSVGDVYVIDAGHDVIDKFDAAGTYLGQITEASAPLGELDGIAVDPAGHVWVYQASGEIDEFDDGLANALLSSRQSPFGTNQGFAVDDEDDLYVLRGEPFVAKLDESGGVLIESIEEQTTSAVAVDLADDDLYLDNLESIGLFSTAGSTAKLLERFGAGHLTAGSGVAVDGDTGTVYVADSSTNLVNVFQAVVVPDVTTGAASGVGETAATVSGEVDPDGEPVTSCVFEYGTSGSYGETAPCSPSPGGGDAPVAVSASLSGLEPRTIYHYRLVATNANGTVEGTDRTFTTIAHATVDGESAGEVTSSSATLDAEIDPGALATTYSFQYGTTTAYGTELPAPPGEAGSGIVDVLVHAYPQGLQASTLYHFRAVAHNALGTVYGPDREFTTQPTGGGPFTLPDGRAYELVSPPDKNGGAVSTDGSDQVSSWQSSPDGDSIAYSAPQPFAGAQTGAATGEYYLATRGPAGWSTQALLPPQAPGCNTCQPLIQMYSEDLQRFVLLDGGGVGLGQDSPPLVAGEPPNNPNLFVHDDPASSYELVDGNPRSATPSQAVLEGASSELTHVVFSENAQLTENAPPGEDLYEWTAGGDQLVSVLPEGEAVGGAVLGNGANRMHAISSDGSRIVFTVGEKLYLREDDDTTIQLDAPQGGTGGGGHGQFMTASSDASKVFFTDGSFAGLTGDTQEESGTNLYEYDVASGALNDLTPASKAEVLGVVGISEDGEYVYFVAGGALTGSNSAGVEPIPEEPNLYVRHGGVTTFIATLDPEDSLDWEASQEFKRTARVTPDGRHAAFESIRSLTGYDNRIASGGSCGEGLGERCTEVFEYDAEAGALTCASCNPSGVRPRGPAEIGHDLQTNFQAEGYLSRNLSDDGARLFFDSADALLPGARNGRQNVYERERDGAGSCAQATGCVYLISTGTSPEDSFFEDASASGDDVFFTTDQRLVGQDVDNARDLYDARVGGGIPEAANPTPCSEEATCRPPTSPPPSPPLVGTVDFFGTGTMSTGGGTGGKVTLAHETIKGTTILLSARVPGSGRVSASGGGIRAASRSTSSAGTYTLTVHLTQRELRRLAHARKVKIAISLRFVPAAGAPSSASVHVTMTADRRRRA